MTAEAMSSLPMQAGSAVLAAAGRTALWAVSLYMRQPLRNTALVALIGVSALAGSNALYKQAHHHPAPLFGSFDDRPAAATKKPAPVMPAARPKQLAEPTDSETTGSVETPARAIQPLGNDDVTALQQKLTALGLFSGSVDGIFGPHTAKAIKAFETSIGRAPKGQLTADIVALVKSAALPSQLPATQADPLPAATPAIETVQPLATAAAAPAAAAPAAAAPATAAPATAAPAALDSDPLPAPTPLLATAAKANTAAELPAATTEVASLTDDAGTDADTVASLPSVTKRAVQTIAVHAKPFAAPADTGAEAQQTMPEKLPPVMDPSADPATDPDVVAAVQRGLNSLGFLHAPVDGVAGETTAKAIRNFEVYFNYTVTGRVTRELVNLLEQNGAVI
jgi:peptidoglycan hydrolase-like protein with peptidoglycan-binding domain